MEAVYLCPHCGAESHERVQFCPFCWNSGSYGPKVVRKALTAPRRVVTSAEVYGRRRRAPAPGPWSAIVGEGAEEPIVLLHGREGSGKSTAMARAAHELYPSAVVMAAEEGDGPGLQALYQRLELASQSVHVLVGGGIADLVEVAREIAAAAIMVDSATAAGFAGSDLIELRRTLKVPVWASLHERRGGDYKGSSDLGHAADVVVQVLGVEKGDVVVQIEKNRFGPLGRAVISR